MFTTPVAAESYAAALRVLVEMAESDAGNSTTVRVRQLLLALLMDYGHQVELGNLLNNADRGNTDAILTVLAGWQRFRWNDIDGLPYAGDFVGDMQARLEAMAG